MRGGEEKCKGPEAGEFLGCSDPERGERGRWELRVDYLLRVQELYANLHVPIPATRILEEAAEVILIWSHSAKVIGPETAGFTTQTSRIQVSPPLL